MAESTPPAGPPPQGPGPYGPPPPGYYQGPPPKKKHTLRNVLLVLLGLGILFVGGCIALVAGLAGSVDEAIQEEEANDRPTDVTEGEAFEHDGYRADAGWSVVPDDALGGASIEGLRLTLEDDQDVGGRSAFLTFRLYRGSEVVGEIECSSNEMQEGEASRAECFSLDSERLGRYDTIRVADGF